MVQDLTTITERQLTNATVRLLSNDVFHIKWNANMDIDISDVDELSLAYASIAQGRKLKVVNELDDFTNITNEARKHAAKTAPDNAAVAYVIKGLGQRMVLKFYLNIRRYKNPTKVFMTFEDANNWLESI